MINRIVRFAIVGMVTISAAIGAAAIAPAAAAGVSIRNFGLPSLHQLQLDNSRCVVSIGRGIHGRRC